jgi:hypothetical protein
VKLYRCFFFPSDVDRIPEVVEFSSADEQSALEHVWSLFMDRQGDPGFELWVRLRMKPPGAGQAH